MNWLSCRNQPRAGRFYAENPISPAIADEFGRRAISSGSCLGQERTRGSDVCSNRDATVSCKHTYEPATRVYALGYYLLPGRDINHGYPCGVSASTFCIKRNETQRNVRMFKEGKLVRDCRWRKLEFRGKFV